MGGSPKVGKVLKKKVAQIFAGLNKDNKGVA